MSAYIIADVDVTDAVQYEQYKTLSSQAMHAHGAEVCVRGGAPQPLEGGWVPSRIVVLKFPSMDKALAFNRSAQYSLAREARKGAAVMRMIVCEGL